MDIGPNITALWFAGTTTSCSLLKVLGFINTPEIKISFEDVESNFENVFNNLNSDKSDIVTVIKKYVPDFMHIETGKHLDQKM